MVACPASSLRRWFDVVAGSLVLLVTLATCLSLSLVLHQRQDARLLRLLHWEERLVGELTRSAAELVIMPANQPSRAQDQIRAIQKTLTQLSKHLQVLKNGGELPIDREATFFVRPIRDPRARQHIEAALGKIEQYKLEFEYVVNAAAMGSEHPHAFAQLQRQLSDSGRELQTLIDEFAATAESESLASVVQISSLQLVLMGAGVAVFLGGVLMFRRSITLPLQRIVEGIAVMQRTGRLVKLPIVPRNELGIVASGFNELAQQVEENKQRLREHIVELQRVNIEIDQLAGLKDDFLMAINHQLRTPLTAIIEGIELIEEGILGPITPDQQAFMRIMDENAMRLLRLIEEVLDLSLLKSGRRPLRREVSDLEALLQRCHVNWQAAAQARALRLRCESLSPVYMDTKAIQEVLDHLLHNAIRHTEEHGEIVIEAETVGSMVQVLVRNEGPGLSQEQLEQLFEPFVHVHTPEAPGSQGSGLGLAFCRQVIERHFGGISASSTEGRGTTLTFTLPIASTQFLFEEACRNTKEDAEFEHGQFGLLLVMPGSHPKANPSPAKDHGVLVDMMRRAEDLLRHETHRGDRFVWVDELTLAIIAITDETGLKAMMHRLRQTLDDARLQVDLAAALFPYHGDGPGQLLEAARNRWLDEQRAASPSKGHRIPARDVGGAENGSGWVALSGRIEWSRLP